MKTIKILSLAAVILALTSCGASKKAQSVPGADEIIQKKLTELAEKNPCQYMATQWTDDEIRAYGEGEGYDEASARLNARLAAENELNSIMNLWASDFTRGTTTAAQAEGLHSKEGVTQQDLIRFAEGDLKGVQVLLTDYEKVANGVLCRMCVTMNAEAATQAILSQAKVQGIIENAEQFREQADEAREQIRLLRTGTNAAKLQQKK